METIRFGKRMWIIILVVLIVAIIIVLSSRKNSKQSNPDESEFARLVKRWRELTHEIEEEMRKLMLTQEMKTFVEKRISYLFSWAKAAFAIIFVIVAILFYWQSQEVFSSLMNTVGLFIFMSGAGSFLLANRFAESNSLIKLVSTRIRKWVYSKYGFDPYEERVLHRSIDEKKMEANLLMVEIRQVNSRTIDDYYFEEFSQ